VNKKITAYLFIFVLILLWTRETYTFTTKAEVNGTALVDNPMTTILSTYTDSLGMGAYAVVLLFVIGGIYLKSHSITTTAGAMLITSMLFLTAGIFGNMPQLSLVSGIVAAASLTLLVISIMYNIRR
jgi:hypothetical protein